MQALAANPQASINAACGGWAETIAEPLVDVVDQLLGTPFGLRQPCCRE